MLKINKRGNGMLKKITKHSIFAALWVGAFFIMQTLLGCGRVYAKLMLDENYLLKAGKIIVDAYETNNYASELALLNDGIVDILGPIIQPLLIMSSILVIFTYFLFVKIRKGRNFGGAKFNVGNIVNFVCIAVIFNFVVSYLLRLLPDSWISMHNASTGLATYGHPLVVLLSAGILTPITEEIVFRYGVFGNLKKINRKYGIIASGILFGAMHGNPIQMAYTSVLGMIFAYEDDKYDSLVPSIVMHVALNSSSILASSFMPWTEEFNLFFIMAAAAVPALLLLKNKCEDKALKI